MSDYGLKDIERLLDGELNNWRRWARQRNYLPAGAVCVLGKLHIRTEEEKAEEMKFNDAPPPDEIEAAAFEKAINALPARLRAAFILHHLDRGHVGHITVMVRDRQTKAMVMKVGARQYQVLLLRAHQELLRTWQRAGLVRAQEA
jgi:hypothetical protein